MNLRSVAACTALMLFVLLSPMPTAGATGTVVRVLLLSGQSNMGGTGNAADLLPGMANQSNVWFDNATPGSSGATTNWTVLGTASSFGPEVGCGFVVANARSDQQLALVKVSKWATSIDDWRLAGNTCFISLTDRIAIVAARLNAQQLAGEITGWYWAGFCWMQGEAEANATVPSLSLAYFDSMTDLVFKVRTATGTTNLPVVLGRTHAGIKVNVPQYLLNVRSNQMRYAQYDPYAAYVDIDDVGLQDDLHLDSLGAMSLGMRMGTAQLGLTEPNPCINLEQAADQPDPTALRTVCFRVRASKPLNSISIADFALSGTAGPTTAAVWRASAYDGTSEVYTVAVSGMTNGGNVSISMPRNKVASGVVSNFPSVSEDNRIAFGLPATTTNLLVHDDGNGPVGRLDKSTPGFGWRNVGWVVNSNPTQGYELTTSAPMTYSNLLVNAPYAKGGTGYLTSGRAFDILNALRPYHTDGDLTNIGRSNDEYWVSFLARRDQDRPWTLALCRYNSATWWDTARVIAVDQAGGYWLLQLMGDGGNQVTTTVAATVGQTYLMVLRIRFAGVLASNTVDLFINPWPLGGDAPSVPTASLSTNAANFKFSRIMWYPGYGVNQGSLDEFRLGTTYAAVTPVLPSNSVPQIQTTNLPLAVLGQPYGTALRAINGAGRVRWILDHGTLPAGVALDALGVISGVPAAAGSNYFRVLARDDAAQAATQSLALAVLPEPAVTLGLYVLAWVCRWTHPCKT